MKVRSASSNVKQEGAARPSAESLLASAPFYTGCFEQAVRETVAHASGGAGGYGVFCNVHVFTSALRGHPFEEALYGAWAVFPDGAPIAWVLRRRSGAVAERIAGPDFMPAVIAAGCEKGLKHFLFGSTPEVLEALVARIVRDFPPSTIVGLLAPAVGAEDGPRTLEAISKAEPDIVWVALGAPKQELWMRTHAATLKPALLIGVGAAFDFNAGTKPRAPVWMQRCSLEWLHRLASEPRRLGPRYLSTNFAFARSIAALLLPARKEV